MTIRDEIKSLAELIADTHHIRVTTLQGAVHAGPVTAFGDFALVLETAYSEGQTGMATRELIPYSSIASVCVVSQVARRSI